MKYMEISGNPGIKQNINTQRIKQVVSEFDEINNLMQNADNMDKVDLNSSKGTVEVDFINLGKDKVKKYSGTVEFNPETKETSDLFVTANYDKKDGVGVNYRYIDKGDGTVTYRRDDMYQEYPMSRDIEELTIDKKTGEVKHYERYEEIDNSPPIFSGGSDVF